MTSLNTQLDISALVEMGFPKERVELAVKSVKNPEIQTVVEWLFSHPVANPDSGHRLGGSSAEELVENESPKFSDDAESAPDKERASTYENSNESSAVTPTSESSPVAPTSESSAAPTSESSTVALSLICEDCGKQIKSEMDAQAHAGRTGHQNFAESSQAIKPLTPEEKEEQKARLQKKLEERRKQREEVEKEQHKLREKARRKTGKELTQAKEEQAHQEMKRIAEERRKEKLEEKRLKQKLKEDIARDRAEFKKQQQTNEVIKNDSSNVSLPAQPVAAKREYSSCRIQFRLMDGSTQNFNFKAEDTLNVIYDHISGQIGGIPFNLSTTFPRKTFNELDMSKTLKELGLIPSAVLVLTKV